eukprot:CAMPEP_0197666964 /NCGR_PEP_ID=MMETSP1338-20131121/64638_1 /TAXON_ID=43686 ORGANISM="Pelagodinium beii, Strain RCC1491" /NCGR_SAMPLE_ID=MMETSP1338 /ASSEMBLY_ACC=CAM_ASM_000754 /LENGTH=56 /DNA_ID=CAMNT_0043246103 /DNA_START=30 /DNA_END=197 /DNA_ORIENTATION=-
MAALGMQTGIVGKNHFGFEHQQPIAHGFQHLQIYDGLGTGFANSSAYDSYDQWFQR